MPKPTPFAPRPQPVELAALDPAALLRLPAVLDRTGLGASSLRRLIAGGRFPEGIVIAGLRARRWRASDVTEWLKAQG